MFSVCVHPIFGVPGSPVALHHQNPDAPNQQQEPQSAKRFTLDPLPQALWRPLDQAADIRLQRVSRSARTSGARPQPQTIAATSPDQRERENLPQIQ